MVEAPDEDAVFAVTQRDHGTASTSPIEPRSGEVFLTVSLGIAYSDGDSDAYGLVRDAAAAMHAARAEGFGRQRVYDRAIASQLLDSVGREAELRRALEENEFVMHYQPLLRLSDRVWDRAETLVRWQHPTRGLVSPGEFIPLAEQTGLMAALGERVFELVIAQAKLWSQTLPGVQLSVNVSGMQLNRPGLRRPRAGDAGDGRAAAGDAAARGDRVGDPAGHRRGAVDHRPAACGGHPHRHR